MPGHRAADRRGDARFEQETAYAYEGETVREKIARGPLAVPDALEYALAAAT